MIQNTITGTNEAVLVSPSANSSLKLICWSTIILAVGAFSAELYDVWEFYAEQLPANDYSTFRIVAFNIETLTWISLLLIAFLIAVRSKSTNAVFVALFLSCYCTMGQFNLPDILWAHAMLSFAAIITGILFILSMQNFPVKIMKAQVETIVRPRLLQWYLKALLSPRNLWIYFMAVLVVITIVEYLVASTNGSLSSLLILLTGFGYLFTSYRLTSGVDHARILWLFWGLTMIILTEALYTAIFMYSPPGEVAQLTLHILYMLILLFSFAMSFFFADAFNTGIFVRKTAVNAVFFLLVVFLYNTLEHYVLHWISHTLHISNAVLAAVSSGFIVLCISPLHHRMTHFLTKKLKDNRH